MPNICLKYYVSLSNRITILVLLNFYYKTQSLPGLILICINSISTLLFAGLEGLSKVFTTQT